MAEKTAAGQDIGALIEAIDPDTRTTAYADLTYWLSGSDARSFTLVPTTGQLQTREPLDHESRAAYTVTVHVRDGKNAAGDDALTEEDDSIRVRIEVGNVDEEGMVELLSSAPQEKQALMATLSDPDGNLSGISWQWARVTTRTGPGTPIPGAMSSGTATATYTPDADDVGQYVRATATYTDVHGTEKDESATTTARVQAAPAVTLVLSDADHAIREGETLQVHAELTPSRGRDRGQAARDAGPLHAERHQADDPDGSHDEQRSDAHGHGQRRGRAAGDQAGDGGGDPAAHLPGEVAPDDVTLTITDNDDTRGVTVTPTELSVNEGASEHL